MEFYEQDDTRCLLNQPRQVTVFKTTVSIDNQ